ncbi:hypothetical protein UB46_05890 [Burkholderiaceae bacterium 16]|nr:hypothetical protein UB46_05890 [Burkholderiaceae bacterium 16]
MPASTSLPSFSLCICTRNHPAGLRRALHSAFASSMPPHQLLVSDDSTNYDTRQMMRAEFPAVRYLEGPRRGNAANRNRMLPVITGTHVLFIDDETVLGQTFLQQVAERIADDNVYRRRGTGPATPLIVTGPSLSDGQKCKPKKSSFLGYPSLNYCHGERLCSVVLHSTVFPSVLFRHVAFDERLAGGYDVIDLASHVVLDGGCRIEWLPSAANQHIPGAEPLDAGHLAEASRIYATLHRYSHYQHRRVKAGIFLLLALAHSLASNLHRSGLRGATAFCATARSLWSHLRSPARAGIATTSGDIGANMTQG